MAGQLSQASPTPSTSASSCPGFGMAGQLSQASPTPSLSVSSCPGFGVAGQLSIQSALPSPSESVSATPQPHTPGSVLSGSKGQLSSAKGKKSPPLNMFPLELYGNNVSPKPSPAYECTPLPLPSSNPV